MSLTETSRPEPKFHPSWLEVLRKEFDKPYVEELRAFLKAEKNAGKTIYPVSGDIFAAFNLTPFDNVKVVLLGQDPYHGRNQAHGLSFSVRQGIRQPPSLQNVFKELEDDLGIAPPSHGDLTHWAKQGVLLLNAILTVEASKAASHRGKGWEMFTDAVIKTISDKKVGVVFLLWGKFAESKKELIDTSKHHVLTSAHPSPYSADKGFFGSRPFSKINAILKKEGKEPIDWKIPEE